MESTEREYQGRREARSPRPATPVAAAGLASLAPASPGLGSRSSTWASSARKASVAAMPIGTVLIVAMPKLRSSQLHTEAATSG